MLRHLKSLPLTVVLTILIWMYAEAQFTSVRDNVELSVKIVSPSPGDLAVRVLDPVDNRYKSTLNVVVSLEGPQNQLDHIYQTAVPGGGVGGDDELANLSYVPPVGILQPGAAAGGGGRSLDVTRILNGMRYFHERGVTITAATPARVELEVDPIEHVSRPVDFRRTLILEKAVLTPDTVTVNVPSRTLQQIGGADKITVAAIPQKDLATLPVGVDQTVPVKFTAEYAGQHDDRITIDPPMGSVTVRVPRLQAMTESIPNVPVFVSGPPALLADNAVDVRPKFLRITVSGAPPAIAALRDRLASPGHPSVGDVGIRATLDLSSDDRASDAYARRRIRYTLPEGLTLQAGPADVEFRLTGRARGAGVGGTTQPGNQLPLPR